MVGAEVVAMGIALGGEGVEPHLGAAVLIGQGDDRRRGAGGPGALANGAGHGGETYATTRRQRWISGRR